MAKDKLPDLGRADRVPSDSITTPGHAGEGQMQAAHPSPGQRASPQGPQCPLLCSVIPEDRGQRYCPQAPFCTGTHLAHSDEGPAAGRHGCSREELLQAFYRRNRGATSAPMWHFIPYPACPPQTAFPPQAHQLRHTEYICKYVFKFIHLQQCKLPLLSPSRATRYRPSRA